jgi:hypothetical protein
MKQPEFGFPILNASKRRISTQVTWNRRVFVAVPSGTDLVRRGNGPYVSSDVLGACWSAVVSARGRRHARPGAWTVATYDMSSFGASGRPLAIEEVESRHVAAERLTDLFKVEQARRTPKR